MNAGSQRPGAQMFEEATGWFLDLNGSEPDVRARKAFNEWLRRSPQHVQAYMEVVAAWEESERLGAAEPREAPVLVAEALRETNIVALTGGGAPAVRVSRRSVAAPGRGMAVGLAAAAALAAVGIAAFLWFRAEDGVTYTTAVAEQRSVMLADGSVVQLSARTRMHVRLSASARDVELLEGQALFQVAQDASRPFVVRTADMQVRAVGTQFDVDRKGTATVVTVVEGRVAVAARHSGGEVLLGIGEQVEVSAGAPASAPHAVDVGSVTAWTQRRLVFDGQSLAEAVAEFNRYSPRPMVLEDIEAGNFHIRGTFSATDPQPFLGFLRDRFGVTVRETGAQIRIAK